MSLKVSQISLFLTYRAPKKHVLVVSAAHLQRNSNPYGDSYPMASNDSFRFFPFDGSLVLSHEP
jgi:hypothetical protein